MGSSDIDDGFDNHPSLVGEDFIHERLVDFQIVNPDEAQIIQRGVTRAEIVNCDPHPLFPERVEVILGLSRVFHDGTLCDLELDACDWNPGLCNACQHQLLKVHLREMGRGDINSHRWKIGHSTAGAGNHVKHCGHHITIQLQPER